MQHRTRLVLIAAASTALVGATAGTAHAAVPSPAWSSRPVGTVFAQTDAVGGNTVVAYDRLADGSLRQAGSYPTGGAGAQLTGSVVDHLASEDSLVRSGSSLFAVNAGSGTITSFAVSGDRLSARQTVGSGGDTPVSIAARGDRVFVLDARGGGSVQGYLNLGGHLVEVPSWHRSLGLDPDATPEFTHTPAQIAFTPDGSELVVSTKGNTSSFDVFRVGPFGISAAPVVTAVPNAVPFGFGFDGRGRIVASEAGPNAVATFAIEPDGSVRQIAAVPTGQQATCWITVDGSHVYASDAGSGSISHDELGQGGTLTAAGTTATDAGTVDSTITPDGRFLYVETGANGVVDEFAVARDGSLDRIGSIAVPAGIGGEGIVAD